MERLEFLDLIAIASPATLMAITIDVHYLPEPTRKQQVMAYIAKATLIACIGDNEAAIAVREAIAVIDAEINQDTRVVPSMN